MGRNVNLPQVTDWILFLEDQPAAPQGGLVQYIAYLPFAVLLFYLFFVMQGGSKRDKLARDNLRKSLKKHDRVLTAGGIYGVVMEPPGESDKVVLRIDESTNAKMTVAISSIAKVLGDETSGDTATKS
jgi:preprotein translocase subunit YajC